MAARAWQQIEQLSQIFMARSRTQRGSLVGQQTRGVTNHSLH
jgi:hypothetical protein